MEDKQEKGENIEKQIEIEENKENIETKEESENENEQKENNNIKQENNEDNKNITINIKTEEKEKEEIPELNNINIIKEDEKEKEKEKTEIILEKNEPEKEDEIKEIHKEKENKIEVKVENNIEEEKKEDNKDIIITNIKNEEKEKEKQEVDTELKNIILNEKNLDELNENEPIFNNEEKENSEDEEPEYSKNDIEGLYLRTKSNKSMKIEQFYEQKRHYFIMTEGGTPIYSRYGDEIKNCSLLATFSAIITKFTIFNNEKNSQEKLNYICNDNSIIAFLKKGKIVFIALSNKTDSLSFLYSQLELLYHQLLSIVTSERMPILEEKPSSCSTVLSGTISSSISIKFPAADRPNSFESTRISNNL